MNRERFWRIRRPSGLNTVNSQGHAPAELKAVAFDIRNKAPEIYGLSIKFWMYFNAFGQRTAPVTGNHETRRMAHATRGCATRS
jgi:hypothetical protein